MTVTLRPITAENWRESAKLKVSEEQQNFVASNLYSIAEAHFETNCVCLAIYADIDANEVMVGFIMYDADDYYIVRFMIDQRFQGKGDGQAAMQLLLDQFAREAAHPIATLSYVPAMRLPSACMSALASAKRVKSMREK